MPRSHHNKRNRQRGKGKYGPPNKRRRLNNDNSFKKPKLSSEESKTKCLNIIKTLQEILKNKSIDLMKLPKFTESDVGIKIFMNNTSKTHKPIIASLKHKYEDFMVSEIDESGNIVKITNNESIKDEHSINKNAILSQSISKVNEELSSLINKEIASNFIKWYKNRIKLKHNMNIDTINDDEDKTEKVENDKEENDEDEEEDIDIDIIFTFPPNRDKEERRSIHLLLKQLEYIETKTNNESCIYAEIVRNKFGKERWPKHRGKYLKFILTKCGMDTIQCVSLINHKLYKNSTKTFSFGGTKDKHAVTSQWVTAYHITCDELKNAVKTMNNKVEIGNFKYVEEQIKLGALKGNQFEIALKNITYYDEEEEEEEKKKNIQSVSENELNERLEILKSMGFINYFGMQRFGSSTVGTHDIGKAIISKQLSMGCALLILPRSNESELFAKQRAEFIESGDITLFPKGLYTEKKILYGLMDDANNYQQSFMKIPRNMRTMYTHSYQSFIWNHCVSQRIDKYGYNVIIGDLVRIKRDRNNDKNNDDGMRRNINDDFEYVTNDNINKYDIFDVVFPLPSPNVMVPKLDTTQFMIDLLKKDGFDLNSFNTLNDSWGINTNYRNIMVKPINIKGELKKYQSNDQLLIDIPFKTDNHNNNNNNNNNNSNNKKEEDHDNDNDKDKIAWIVSFGLPKSTYATMCVRQLLFIASLKLKR